MQTLQWTELQQLWLELELVRWKQSRQVWPDEVLIIFGFKDFKQGS